MEKLEQTAAGAFELQPFERGRRSVLAAALAVGPGAHVVLELFDKQGSAAAFTAEDRRLVSSGG